MNGRQLGWIRAEERSHGDQIRQIAGVQGPGQFFGKFALATAVMSQCQKLNGDLASLFVGKMLDEGFEGLAVFLAREELVAINEAAERHRLFAQGMDDVVVVDDLIVNSP